MIKTLFSAFLCGCVVQNMNGTNRTGAENAENAENQELACSCCDLAVQRGMIRYIEDWNRRENDRYYFIHH